MSSFLPLLLSPSCLSSSSHISPPPAPPPRGGTKSPKATVSSPSKSSQTASKQAVGGLPKSPIKALDISGSEFIFSYKADPFGFAVKRKSNGQTLFNPSAGGSDPFGQMVFKDQYLEISTSLPNTQRSLRTNTLFNVPHA